MSHPIRYTEEQSDFLESTYACVDNRWYYYPGFLEKLSDTVFRQVPFNELPEHVQEFIKADFSRLF